jgi:hypothetical protein
MSSIAFANPSISEECLPKYQEITGSTFSVIAQEPSSVACGQEILKATDTDSIFIGHSLSGVFVATAEKNSRQMGLTLFYVWDFESAEEAVSYFCDPSQPVENIKNGPPEVSILCAPQK